MIVYGRKLKKEDVIQIKDDEELIYYYNSNIAFIVNRLEENNYIVRKKKIFNNQLMDEKIKKTAEQIMTIAAIAPPVNPPEPLVLKVLDIGFPFG